MNVVLLGISLILPAPTYVQAEAVYAIRNLKSNSTLNLAYNFASLSITFFVNLTKPSFWKCFGLLHSLIQCGRLVAEAIRTLIKKLPGKVQAKMYFSSYLC